MALPDLHAFAPGPFVERFSRAFEERSYRSISHLDVGMAILVHRSLDRPPIR